MCLSAREHVFLGCERFRVSLNAQSLYRDADATLDDLREAVTILEDAERTARRVLGGAHPVTYGVEQTLRNARAALRARDTPSANA